MKGLEALNNIKRRWGSQQDIEIIEKELKALEILRNKKVNLEYLKCCINYEQYKFVCSYWNKITEQEYDLLKEMLSK